MRFHSGSISIVITLTVFLACSKTDYPRSAATTENPPDASLDDATIVLTKDGRPTAVVSAAHLERWEAKDSTEATSVSIVLYDSLGNQHAVLSGKRGLLREKTTRFALFGDVVGVSRDSSVLRTQSLYWEPKQERIVTEDYVEIARPDGDVLRGWGLTADRDLRHVEIKKDVSGRVQKAAAPKKEEETSSTDDSASH